MIQGNLILDLQYGSTGKGLIAGCLAHRNQPDTIATAWAPNAGHTFIDTDGQKYVHTMLANGIVSRNLRMLLIGPGSLINAHSLRQEIDVARALGLLPENEVKIFIHPNAAVVTQQHRDLEAGPMTKIGSTKKGVGEAMIQRIRRDPDNLNIAYNPIEQRVHEDLVRVGLAGNVVTSRMYQAAWESAEVIQIEGAQGYSLSMYHGMYPYTTSRDISLHQTLADVALPPRYAAQLRVVGCARTYPIRVANRFDESGAQVGYSGPCYSDQQEISWDQLGLEPELTTVTRLPRRLFTFSHLQLDEAIRQCGVDELFLNFVNYISPDERQKFCSEVEFTAECAGASLSHVGLGPTADDVFTYCGSTIRTEFPVYSIRGQRGGADSHA